MHSSRGCGELDPIGSIVSNPVANEADGFMVGQQEFSQETYVLPSSSRPHVPKSNLNSIQKVIKHVKETIRVFYYFWIESIQIEIYLISWIHRKTIHVECP